MGKETSEKHPQTPSANDQSGVFQDFGFPDIPAHCRAFLVGLPRGQYLRLIPRIPDNAHTKANCDFHCLSPSLIEVYTQIVLTSILANRNPIKRKDFCKEGRILTCRNLRRIATGIAPESAPYYTDNARAFRRPSPCKASPSPDRRPPAQPGSPAPSAGPARARRRPARIVARRPSPDRPRLPPAQPVQGVAQPGSSPAGPARIVAQPAPPSPCKASPSPDRRPPAQPGSSPAGPARIVAQPAPPSPCKASPSPDRRPAFRRPARTAQPVQGVAQPGPPAGLPPPSPRRPARTTRRPSPPANQVETRQRLRIIAPVFLNALRIDPADNAS